jgi:hypothetical protein
VPGTGSSTPPTATSTATPTATTKPVGTCLSDASRIGEPDCQEFAGEAMRQVYPYYAVTNCDNLDPTDGAWYTMSCDSTADPKVVVSFDWWPTPRDGLTFVQGLAPRYNITAGDLSVDQVPNQGLAFSGADDKFSVCVRTYNSAPVTVTVIGDGTALANVENICVASALRTDAEAAQVVDGLRNRQ